MATEEAVQFAKDKWNYIWNYKNYVRDLEREREHLVDAREGLEHEAEEARDNGGIIEKEVTAWLKDAEKLTSDARDVQEKKKHKSCFRGSIIVNPYTRYRIGKDAKELTDSIQQLETRKNGLRRISYRSAPGKVRGLYGGISYYVAPSRDAILRDISRALMDSDAEVVGVYGTSGVGKSTLVMQVAEQVHRKLLHYDFGEVVMATVSRDPNYEKIQGELAHGLGLKFENETDVDKKADRLRDRLSQEKKILIILDDIWKKLELDKLGIHNGKRIKLLLTSRSEQTLKNEMNCGQNFELRAFSKEEAMNLFKGIVGRQIEDELLELVGKKIVEEGACLPIYIVPLATKLKTYAPSTWEKALDDLKESNKLGVNKLISEALVDGEVINKLFLLCGQIGNQIIAIEDLLIYGIGLGLFQGINTIEECRERLKTLLESLKSFCFLEDYGNDHVKIHDVMSEASLSMALATEHSLVLRDEKQLRAHLAKNDVLSKCKSISLPFVGDITGALLEGLKCPELDIFLLYMDENCQIQDPNLLFDGMEKLKVLDIYGASFTSLPSSIPCMKELRSLCLDRCQVVGLKIIGQLTKLQVLTLRGSDILVLPREVGNLIDLRLLDLSECDLDAIEHGALGSLVNLEELYLPENYESWEAEGFSRASLHELTGLTCLTSLTICVPNLTELPHDFPFANLKRYKIVTKGLHSKEVGSGGKINPKDNGKPSPQGEKLIIKDYFIEFDKTKTLRLKLDTSDRIFLEDWVQTSLHNAQKLELLGWRGYEKSITELSKQDFSELKHVVIQNSPRIQYIFRPKDHLSSALLELLHLERLINLERIYQGNLPTNSFINLKILRVKACHKLQNLLSPSLAKGLSRIQEIEVSFCKKLSDIVALDVVCHMEPKSGGGIKFELLELKCLHKLVLSDLPEISSFYAKEKGRGDNDDASPVAFLDGRQVSFPSLESVVMSELPEVKKIFDGKFPVKLQRLRLLEVKSCNNLLNVLESNLQLKNLEALAIESCRSVGTIFNLEKSNQGQAIKSQDLAKLRKLKLIDLPSLHTIWPNIKEGSLMRNLNQLEVAQCHQLTHLFSSVTIKSMQKISQISIDNCKKMKWIVVEENDSEDIDDTIEFSSLLELRISNMGSLAMFASGTRTFDFPHLKKLEISHCSKMNTFIPAMSNNAVESGNASSSCIEKLVTRSCHGIGKFLPLKVETTSSRAELDGAGHESFFSTKVILPSLEKLILSSLGCFKSIWESSLSDDSFCKLASVQIEKCNSLKILVLPEHGQEDFKRSTSSELQLEDSETMKNSLEDSETMKNSSVGFPFLTNIKIDECDELRSLFPDTTARTLFELGNLHISSCEKMVTVVYSTPIKEMMTFYKLCSMKLENLQELRSFSTGSVDYYFPFLKELWISGCTTMKAFVMSSNSSTDVTPFFHGKAIIPNLEKLHIQDLGLEEIFSPGLSCKLKDLKVEACHRLSTVIPSFIFPNMQGLESLTVKNCESVRVIYKFDGYTIVDRKLKNSKSWKLKTMELDYLPCLQYVCQYENFSDYFPFSDLAILKVQQCDLLINIFEVSTTKILEKLQKLSIEGCESMEQVIEYGRNCSTSGTNTIILHQLSFLKLSNLPKLSSFCGKHVTEWPSLTNMEVSDCDNVEAFVADLVANVEAFVADSKPYVKPLFLLEKVAFPKLESLEISDVENMKELWNIGTDLECSSETFSKLKKFKIVSCGRLSTIFPSKMVEGFKQLEEMEVRDCGSLEHVFQVQDFRRETESNDNNSSFTIPFSLRELVLKKLPAMDHVWNIENNEGINLIFEKLRKIKVSHCESLKHLFPDSIARYLDQLNFLKIKSCKDMEEIVQKKVSRVADNYADSQHHQFLPADLKVTTLELQGLPELKSIPCKNNFELRIRGCPKVKIPGGGCGGGSSGDIINPAQKDQVNIFSSLKGLITDMEGLQEMQYLDGLDNLIVLIIRGIDDAAAKRFPWRLLLERFHNLKRLRIDDSHFEELFLPEDEEEAEEDKGIAPYSRSNNNPKLRNTHLQSLRELVLGDLPELKQVWREASVMEEVLHVVRYLGVDSCRSLTHLFEAPASFSNLARLEVSDCEGMVYLLTSSAARCLPQLTILEIAGCEKMEEIVKDDKGQLDGNGNGGANGVCFPRLRVVQLDRLNKLRSFCSSNSCKFEFPSLESVSLEGVDKLEAFCQGGFEAPLLWMETSSPNQQLKIK